MQQDLETNFPDLEIDIIGINEAGFESGNVAISTGRDIPWLQDVNANSNGLSDLWSENWDVTFRDVIILDRNNEVVNTFNITTNDLSIASNYDTLLFHLLDATMEPLGRVAELDLSDLITPTAPGESDGFVLRGETAQDHFGFSVSGAGDINGDGFDDLLIGARLGDTMPDDQVGETYVVFGQAENYTSTFDLSSLDGDNGFVLRGAADFDNSGYSVSGAGDVNGDGFGDLIIGALYADLGSKENTGAAYVVYGHAHGFPPVVELANLSPEEGFVIQGTNAEDRLGQSVSGAGDFNGDGFDDVIVGAPGADPDGRAEAGYSYVIFGSREKHTSPVDVSALDGVQGFALRGINPGDESGRAVASIGDINGDHLDDIIIGAWLAGNGVWQGSSQWKEKSGQSYVVLGRAESYLPEIELFSLFGRNGFVLYGNDTTDFSGFSVGSAGDFNGDGLDDLVVGASGGDPGGDESAGETYILFGSIEEFPESLNLTDLNGVRGFTIQGANAGDHSGFSISSAGDFNADGYDDLLIGAPSVDPNGREDAGRTYVLFGRAGTFSKTIDLNAIASMDVFVIDGIDPGDASGQNVNAAGDFNGDGFADVMIGAFNASQYNRPKAGESYLVNGSDVFGDHQHVGDQNANVLRGDSGDQSIIGGTGDDLLFGSGRDVLFGGQGNDFIHLSDSEFFRIDGGPGVDTLVFDGNGIELDLSQLTGGLIRNIERFDISGNGANTLRLSARDVLALSNSSNTILIDYDTAEDILDIGPGWDSDAAQMINDRFYVMLTQGEARLQVAYPEAVLGDLNGESTVGVADLAILRNNFAQAGTVLASQGDLNGDGSVDRSDFHLLAHNFGYTSPFVGPANSPAIDIAHSDKFDETELAEPEIIVAFRAVIVPPDQYDLAISEITQTPDSLTKSLSRIRAGRRRDKATRGEFEFRLLSR